MPNEFTAAIARAFDIRELHNLLVLAFKLLPRVEYQQVEWQAFRRAEQLQ